MTTIRMWRMKKKDQRRESFIIRRRFSSQPEPPTCPAQVKRLEVFA
jgi:hypothetical protein